MWFEHLGLWQAISVLYFETGVLVLWEYSLCMIRAFRTFLDPLCPPSINELKPLSHPIIWHHAQFSIIVEPSLTIGLSPKRIVISNHQFFFQDFSKMDGGYGRSHQTHIILVTYSLRLKTMNSLRQVGSLVDADCGVKAAEKCNNIWKWFFFLDSDNL